MPYKKICSKCKIEKYLKDFYVENNSKDKLSSYCKECSKNWKKINRESAHRHRKNYYYNNRDKEISDSKKCHKNNIDSWRTYFAKIFECSICDRKIGFFTNSPRNSVHFDHRNGGKEQIKGSPKHWLRSHKRNLINEKIWKSCNFGILCEDCNRSLPTINRKIWLRKTTKYILDKES